MPTVLEAAQPHSAAARHCFGVSNFAVFVVSNSLRLRGASLRQPPVELQGNQETYPTAQENPSPVL